MTPLRELRLVEQYRAGGCEAKAALTELIQGYQRRVYSICYRMVRNPDDAADLTQDALIKMIEGLESYDGRSKLSTWAIRVTLNCCLSHLRRQRLRGHQSLDRIAAQTEAGTEPPGNTNWGQSSRSEPSPVQGVEQAQRRSTVLRALDALEPDTRAILVLRDLQDLDYQQLAEVFDVPVGTVKSRLFRARAALRDAIEALERN